MKYLSRRELLIAGAGTLVLAACGTTTKGSAPGSPVLPTDPVVAAREKLRGTGSGRVSTATITAAPTTATIGGKEVSTWAFGSAPGQGGLRLTAGNTLEARFVNRLDAANTIHWHGIALRNDMDGVHDLTQAAVEPGGEFTYRFVVPDPGTYWFHPHMGLELDRGLYAPLIVEDPNDASGADVDATLLLDDWLDGYGRTQQDVLAELKATGGHSGHDMGDMGGGMGGMGGMGGGMDGMGGMGSLAGDVTYPLHVINGRGPTERDTVTARAGQRVRLRLINAGSDTAYRVAVAGHRLTITHTDGFPITPVEVDAVVLGMGERYDVLLTAASGAFPIVAVPEGKDDPAAEAVLRTSDGASSPAVGSRPSELDGKIAGYHELHATDAARLPSRQPDRKKSIALTASSTGYVHGIDGRSFPDTEPITVDQGERLRLTIMNDTMMFHPIHLHGHTFQMVEQGSARKDTVNVPSMGAVVVDIEADNPGQWMLHCHNTYHLETGMATVFSYQS